ncbi:hypothetical protein LX36DRAFT_480351 [Colletotrichum falcatum]|nr:hypothetical protein LX36DRAFT_480351 [Colletotrichum falcatum]
MRPGIPQMSVLLLLLWSLVLVASARLPAVPTVPKALNSLQSRDVSDGYDNAYILTKGPWACNAAKRRMIDDAIKEAQELAEKAIGALKVKGAETSIAFRTWFGESNATPQMVNTLINQHYQTAFSHLRRPRLKTTLGYRGGLNFIETHGDPRPTANSLAYTCPPASGEYASICASDTVAAQQRLRSINSAGRTVPGTTFLILCPRFFKRRETNAQTIKMYKKDFGARGKVSKGYILLHELQHMEKATSPNPPADDLDDPLSYLHGGGQCYTASCCARLSDSKKIQNAENFALFALDVSAFPRAGKPTDSHKE